MMTGRYDEYMCVVETARSVMASFAEEQCAECGGGKCGEDVARIASLLAGMCAGTGAAGDIETIEAACIGLRDLAPCEAVCEAAGSVLGATGTSRAAFEAHIRDKRCPAGVCPDLTRFVIDALKCNGCGKCEKVCPADAITGGGEAALKIYRPRAIDALKCVSCGSCRAVCSFNAVFTEEK